jgi:hypothetical protein
MARNKAPGDAIRRVTRIEVINEIGRVYVRDHRRGGPIQVELSYQDNGRTLKVFVTPRESERKEVGHDDDRCGL